MGGENLRFMRDLVLREGLRTMAGDAALRLRELLAAGAEVPYEVRESGSGSALAEYVPQTSRFIRDHAGDVTGLDSFGTTCAAMESAELAGTYLEEMGVPDPNDPRRRAELAGVVFLCRLWQGSTDFTLDDARLEATMNELLDLGEVTRDEVEIAVPLRGFQMEAERLELTGAMIVRSDVVAVPAEARGGEGMGAAAWEPSFLAIARIDGVGAEDDGSDLGLRSVNAFKRVITTLRMFKAGGVALGPHAWIRTGGDRWRRIATGAGKPRPGGYRLASTEVRDLQAFSGRLAADGAPFLRIEGDRKGFPASLGRAISRFEAGLERPVTVEALNDYLLTLRFLLEGGGPASLGMSMRVAALCAEPDNRTEVKETVDRALALERELWSGEPAMGSTRRPPAEVAAEVEDLTRAILGDAACGHLGTELRVTADEILLGDGLKVGEGGAPDTRGETAEWDPAMPIEPGFAVELSEELDSYVDAESEFEAVEDEVGAAFELDEEPEVEPEEEREPVAGFLRAENRLHEHLAMDVDFEWQDEPKPSAERESIEVPEEQPLAEVHVLRTPSPDNEGPVAELIADSDEHRRQVHARVSFLFPTPETTEWKVREVGYDRTRRAEVDDSVTRIS